MPETVSDEWLPPCLVDEQILGSLSDDMLHQYVECERANCAAKVEITDIQGPAYGTVERIAFDALLLAKVCRLRPANF